jgi:hypothetical protein
MLLHKVLDDGFLVFDGHIVPIQLVIHGYAGVARYVKSFDHMYTLLAL